MIKLIKVKAKRNKGNFKVGEEYTAKVSGNSINVYDTVDEQWCFYSNLYLNYETSIYMNFEIIKESEFFIHNKRELKEFIKGMNENEG